MNNKRKLMRAISLCGMLLCTSALTAVLVRTDLPNRDAAYWVSLFSLVLTTISYSASEPSS